MTPANSGSPLCATTGRAVVGDGTVRRRSTINSSNNRD